MDDEIFEQHFIIGSFLLNGCNYNVCLAEEMFSEEDGLEFTGCYEGLLLSDHWGTMRFTLEPDPHLKWQMSNKLINLGVMDEIVKILEAYQKNLSNTPDNSANPAQNN